MSEGGARRTRLLAALKFVLGLALLVVLIRWLSPSWSEINATMTLDFRYAVVALLGTAGATAAASMRWRILAELMGGARLSYGLYFHYLALTRLIGQFTSVALMDLVGRGVAVSAANREGPQLGQHVGALVVERLLDLLLPICAFGWAVASVRGVGTVNPWASLTGLLVVFFFAAVPLLAPASRLAASLLTWVGKLRRRPSSVAVVPASQAVAARVSALSVARYVAVLVQFWGTGALAGLSIDALTMAYATPVSQLTAFIGITPGGIGIQDAGWAGALTWLGQGGAAVAAYIVVTRVAIVANFAVLALVSLPWAGRRSSALAAP